MQSLIGKVPLTTLLLRSKDAVVLQYASLVVMYVAKFVRKDAYEIDGPQCNTIYFCFSPPVNEQHESH